MQTTYERPLVLKWGTSSTTNKNGIDGERIAGYAEQVAAIKERFKNIILVASGSVAVGASVWREVRGDEALPSKQTQAMLGTARAHGVWESALAKHGILAGQLLATHNQIDDISVESILDATIQDNFKHGVIPVGNENDAMSLEEMAKLSYGGENDGFASHMAVRFDAEALILNSDTEGLMQRDDMTRLIRRVDFNELSAYSARVQAGWVEESDQFTNNAISKVDACINASLRGIPSYMAKAGTSIMDILEQKEGTYFEQSAWRA